MPSIILSMSPVLQMRELEAKKHEVSWPGAHP